MRSSTGDRTSWQPAPTSTWRRAGVGLAEGNRVPNLLIGPYYQRDDLGTITAGFRSWNEIPVINSGKPMVRQRAAELRTRQQVFEQMQIRARLEAQTAVARYERARQVVVGTSQDYLEQLTAEVRRVEAQYNAGQTDLLRVYAARASLVDSYRARLDALNELAQAAAAVTAATGLAPEMLIDTNCKTCPPMFTRPQQPAHLGH